MRIPKRKRKARVCMHMHLTKCTPKGKFWYIRHYIFYTIYKSYGWILGIMSITQYDVSILSHSVEIHNHVYLYNILLLLRCKQYGANHNNSLYMYKFILHSTHISFILFSVDNSDKGFLIGISNGCRESTWGNIVTGREAHWLVRVALSLKGWTEPVDIARKRRRRGLRDIEPRELRGTSTRKLRS